MPICLRDCVSVCVSVLRERVCARGLHRGPETRGPGTRPGSYFKWSAGSGSGPNLLLRVPGLFNIVCNTRVDREEAREHRNLPVISVSWHFMCVLYLATCKIKLKNERK